MSWESTIRKIQLQRRGCRVFKSMSITSFEEEMSTMLPPLSTSNIPHVERVLSNRDFYVGLWCNDRPHGIGRYHWTDGCSYEGEWYHGKTMGKGKFLWPSGASYEGEFKSGFLDGFGTFIGVSGDTYHGYYSMNLKHGQGKRTYVNGDSYEGGWKCGVQDRQGKYVWKSGHEYNGCWKDGVINGKGVMVWANGNSYDGEWDAGVPCGKGQYNWEDGSLYVGVWNKDGTITNGVYIPSATSTFNGSSTRDPQNELTADLESCKICSSTETSLLLPSQKSLHWPPRALDAVPSSKQRKNSVDAGKMGMGKKKSGNFNGLFSSENDVGGGERDSTASITDIHDHGKHHSILKWIPREMKKQGEKIAKGHKNYELMLNLQLGIRHSVARPAPATSLDLKSSTFNPKEKVWTKFPPGGSKQTPPHQSCEFKWKDYCPVVFRTLRKLFKVDAADYMISICGNDALRELSSPGKSGSFFYLTNDDRYMIKTLKKAEVKVLLRMLPAYYSHVRSNESTLVTKFCGLHCVKLTGTAQKKVRFVIMGNLFCTEHTIHRRFDLKGSSHGRTTDKTESEIDEHTTLKDLDLNFIFRLQKSWFQEFQRQVDKDCDFLEQEKIMDYSLLVGVHFKDTSLSTKDPKTQVDQGRNHETCKQSDGANSQDHVNCDSKGRDKSTRLGMNQSARVEHVTRKSDFDGQMIGAPTGEFYDVILFFGIIDILQDYDITKKLEHVYKSIQFDPTSISAVDPRQYSRRFRDFIYKAFTEEANN